MLKKLLQCIAWLTSKLPLSAALALGRGLGWIYGSVVRYHRKDAFEALERVYPDKTKCDVRVIVNQMYAGLGMNLVELTRLIGTKHQEGFGDYIEVEGIEYFREAHERKKGVLVLTGHIGSFDLLCTVTPKLAGVPLTVITKKIKQESLNELWLDIREKFGVRFLPAHNSYRQCLKVLRKNEIIGFILDQNMINKEGVFVDFFDRPACTSPGLAYMAAQSGAPVVPAFIKRRPDGAHSLKLLPLLEPPKDRTPESIHAATQLYTKVLEEYIRENPEDWIWLHRRWRTQPPRKEKPQESSP